MLLNGGGFHAPDWSVRVSLPNLDDDVYHDIGRAVRAVARSYVMAFQAAQAAAAPAAGRGHRLDDWFVGVLRHHPEVTFFLSDRLRARQSQAGQLQAGRCAPKRRWPGVAIGQLGVQVSGEVKQCFFLLFLFSIGPAHSSSAG